MNPSHRRAGWKHRKDGSRVNRYTSWVVTRYVSHGPIPFVWKATKPGTGGARFFPRWSSVNRALGEAMPKGKLFRGVDMGRPGRDRTAEMTLYVDGKRAPQITDITWGGIPIPHSTIHWPKCEITGTVELTPEGQLFTRRAIEASMATDAFVSEVESRFYGSPFMSDAELAKQIRDTSEALGCRAEDIEIVHKGPGRRLAKMKLFTPDAPEFIRVATTPDGSVASECPPWPQGTTVREWFEPPEFAGPQSPEQILENIKEFRHKFPPPPESIYEMAERKARELRFEVMPPSFVDTRTVDEAEQDRLALVKAQKITGACEMICDALTVANPETIGSLFKGIAAREHPEKSPDEIDAEWQAELKRAQEPWTPALDKTPKH